MPVSYTHLPFSDFEPSDDFDIDRAVLVAPVLRMLYSDGTSEAVVKFECSRALLDYDTVSYTHLPRPAPSAAPSISPGISAATKPGPSGTLTTPRLGESVVKW